MLPQRKISNRNTKYYTDLAKVADLSKSTNLSKSPPNTLSWNSLDSMLPEITKKKQKKKKKKKNYQKKKKKFCPPQK